MKIFRFFATALAVLVLPLSCVDKEALDNRLDGLEEKIVALEGAVIEANANAVALSTLLSENTLVVGVKETESGYILEIEDGKSIEITFGTEADTIIPIVGIDADGNWVMSYDNGETFTKIPGCPNAFISPATTPQIKIDAEGYWTYSMDGKEWIRILGNDGNPISATDGKKVAGVKSYFSAIDYTPGASQMKVTLIDGTTFTVPVVSSFYLNLKEYAEKAPIALGQTLTYEVEMSDIADIAVQAPQGWTVIVGEKEINITAPETGETGEYTISFLIVSSEGYLKRTEIVLTLTSELI
jgi:hypothetical protein